MLNFGLLRPMQIHTLSIISVLDKFRKPRRGGADLHRGIEKEGKKKNLENNHSALNKVT